MEDDFAASIRRLQEQVFKLCLFMLHRVASNFQKFVRATCQLGRRRLWQRQHRSERLGDLCGEAEKKH